MSTRIDTQAQTPITPAPASAAALALAGPSSLYRAGIWRLGLRLAGLIPAPMINAVCGAGGAIYGRLGSRRREIVIRNLLPVLKGDRELAAKTALSMFRQFGLKLADLWRYEAGLPVASWQMEPGAWDLHQAALARGRGVLLVTPHLGNWEIGGALLAERGVKLWVITQAEPDRRLTELRTASRARWGVGTLVIGGDPFAFVEVLKRLDEGATVAMLIDRPVGPATVQVELFGKPFPASIAAAELARASGCALVGVTVVRRQTGYKVRLLPEFSYDRPALRSREARAEITQRILRAFEPEIQQYPDQWYHFIPIWPDGAGTPSR
jgi:lauroyl/myristoyl acyltransferase